MWRLEKGGYAVVASNVRSRALKILYRVYAQQRLKFKEEIFDEIQRLGGHSRPRSNILGILHRGRIDIFTAMMIGDEGVENLLLTEILVGESAALRAHEKTLKADLPPETREMVERQFNEVRNILGQARLMKGIIGMGSLGVLAGILAALGIAQISHSAGEEAPLVITILALLGSGRDLHGRHGRLVHWLGDSQ